MQFFRPSSPASAPKVPGPARATTFGQQRAQAVQNRIEASVRERQRLAAAQQAADKPLDQLLRQKGELVGRRIAQLDQSAK